MTIYDFAKKLNGRTYGNELTLIEEREAKNLGFVVLFGYSDDCAEFRGAYEDEVGCFNGGRVYEDGDKYINSIWCKGNADWTYETNIPHATFDIYDDGELYCRGIVFEKQVNQPKDRTKLVDERSEEISNGLAEIVRVIRRGVAEDILNDINAKLGENPLESDVVIPVKQVYEYLSELADKFGVWQEKIDTKC